MAEQLFDQYIKLNEYVVEIIKNTNGYLVKTNLDENLAKKVVITCLPKKINDIKFTPSLLSNYTEWFDSYENDKAFKFILFMNKIFEVKNQRVDISLMKVD